MIERLLSSLILVGLIGLPAILMIVVRIVTNSRPLRLLAAGLLAFAAGGAAWSAASGLGWRPMLRGGHSTESSPEVIFWMFTVSIFLLGAILALGGDRDPAPGAPPAPASEGAWRVGHAGRDGMYYEEFRGGALRRLEISGEMLMGEAHHAIYFASPAEWEQYPDWARGRRGEIIARIRSAFPPPDYQHHGA